MNLLIFHIIPNALSLYCRYDSVSQLHIVNVHSKYNGSLAAALAADDSTGLAVLGFLIEVSKTTFCPE